MDIQLAKQTLENVVKSRIEDTNAIQLALDLLNEKFLADFSTLETAQKEADDNVAEVARQKNIVAEKESIISSVNSVLDTTKAELDVTKVELEDKKVTLVITTKEKDDLQIKANKLEESVTNIVTVLTDSLEKVRPEK